MDRHTLYVRALSYALQSGDTSCAGLQRNLQIGYETAAELRQLLLQESNPLQTDASSEKRGTEMNAARHEDCDPKGPPEPFFQPWVGANYLSNENRLLILGESHYGDKDMGGDTTVRLTQEYMDGEWSHRFWTSIMQVVSGQPYGEIDRAEFWSNVAFYNYIQEPVAETAGVAPTPEMFKAAKEPFSVVIDRLKPAKILVLSARLWNPLNADGVCGPPLSFGESTRETLLYNYDGGYALASWIPHPSLAFSWQAWHPLVAALLATEKCTIG